MRLEINEERKMAIIWACSDESTDVLPPEITEQLAPLRVKYRKFKVVVMRSGTEDLFEPTLTLLLSNRMKMAEQEVKAKKIAGQTPEPA